MLPPTGCPLVGTRLLCSQTCILHCETVWPEERDNLSLRLLICKMELLLILSYLQDCYEGQICI